MKRTTLILSLLLLLVTTACTVMNPPAVETPAGETPAGETPAVETPAVVETAAPQVITATPTQPSAPEPIKTEDVTPTQPVGLSAEQFDAALIQAIETKDFAALRGLMGSRFTLAGWRSEGRELSPEAALAELSQTALGSSASPAASTGMDTVALLEGADPLNFFPPDAVRAVYFDFVGANGADQALAIIGRDPVSGMRYWKGMLIAMGGFRMDEPDLSDVNQFSQALGDAVLLHDFDTLRSMMGSQFAFALLDPATLGGSLTVVPAADAIQQLRSGALAEGSDPVILWNTDIPALLSGSDPLAQWGPSAAPIRAIHFTSLGVSNTREAVLVIAREPSGRLYWHGMLEPLNRDTFADPHPAPVGDALPTDVRYVMALDDLNVRSGPGLNYAVEGKVSEGMIAKVSGISPDGGWWQIFCTQDSSGRCWISADPTLSEPTSAP